MSTATRTHVTWTLVRGTPDYVTPTGWRAVYLRTVRGLGCYRIERPDGSTWGTGGLPETVQP